MLQLGDTLQDGVAVFKVKKFGADGALVGSVTWYAGAGTPENYLLCDGSAVSRTDYADLFAVIGTTYGAGDGSTTFNLPLLTDNRFIEGSNVAGNQPKAGLPNIEGYIIDKDQGVLQFDIGYEDDTFGGALIVEGTRTCPAWGSSLGGCSDTIRFDASKSNSIYGSSTTVQPQSLTLRPLIKYI